MRAAEGGGWHRTDDLGGDGGRDRQWRGVREGPRLRRLAWTGAQADLDGGPYNPWQDIEARQSLPARPVRAGGLGPADQTEDLGAPWAQALDRSRQEAATPQRAGNPARRQACPEPLGRSYKDRQLVYARTVDRAFPHACA